MELLENYGHLFGFDGSTRAKIGEHKIDLIEGAKPFKIPPRRTPFKSRPFQDEEAMRLFKTTLARHASGEFSSCGHDVEKKDGSRRFVIDYRYLNSITKKDNYPLPVPEDLLQDMNGAKFFSSLDLESGYWQIPMRECDIAKTAFSTHKYFMEFVVMPMGLCNAPATFQRTMNRVLGHLTWCVRVYLDDIIIFTMTWEEHLYAICLVFEALEEAGFKLKRSKCVFATTRISFLGHIVSAEGISPNRANISKIQDFPVPASPKEKRFGQDLFFIGIGKLRLRFLY